MNVLAAYSRLKKKYGRQGWWPLFMKHGTRNMEQIGDWRVENELVYGVPYARLKKYKKNFRDPYFEIAVGAILTQNTAWKNVAVAIANLYNAKALTPRRLLKLPAAKLQKLIRPAGYFRQKTKKLVLFSRWLVDEFDGNFSKLMRYEIRDMRYKLLAQWGVGRETADSIILYALNKPIFVVDEYTRRLCRQYGVEFKDYDEYGEFFEMAFSGHDYSKQKLVEIYQEYHGLIVRRGKLTRVPLSLPRRGARGEVVRRLS